MDLSLGTFLYVWEEHNEKLRAALRGLTDEQMALRVHESQWSVWQLASHMAGARMYWFDDVLLEEDDELRDRFRIEQTTVPGLSLEDAGWEDDDNHPRSSAEVVDAFERTWAYMLPIIRRWTPEELAGRSARLREPETRLWVLAHLFEHEGHHGGEISLILGANGLQALKL